jgi:hypothetical protein
MVVTPATEPEPLATGAASPEAASPGREEDGCEASDSSGEEQSAAAALLGLHAAWPSSPDEEEDAARDDGLTPLGYDLWDAAAAAAGHRMFYDSPTALSSLEPYSPKNYRQHNLVDYDTPGHPSPKRMRAPKDGAPPPGTSRFRCKFPGCRKLYASTDAVRKHCRKRHLDWLRQIDRYSAHERGMPKPAMYCVWGDDERELM